MTNRQLVVPESVTSVETTASVPTGTVSVAVVK